VETIDAYVGRMIYEAQIKAGLSPQEHADLIGTKQPVIAHLEERTTRGTY